MPKIPPPVQWTFCAWDETEISEKSNKTLPSTSKTLPPVKWVGAAKLNRGRARTVQPAIPPAAREKMLKEFEVNSAPSQNSEARVGQIVSNPQASSKELKNKVEKQRENFLPQPQASKDAPVNERLKINFLLS